MNTVDTTPRYAWVTVLMLLLLLMVVQGIITAGISTFDGRIIEALGISRGALKFRDFMQIIAAGIAGICIGYITGYVRPMRLAQTGLALLVVCLAAYSRVTNVWMIYGIHLVMGFCYSSAHVVIVVLIIKQWFDKRQAVAIGITLSGASLGSALFPQIVVHLMRGTDWRHAMLTLAIFPLVLLPFVLVFLRERPTLAADVAQSLPAATSETHQEALPSWRVFIPLAIAAFGIFYVAAAVIYHTFLNLKDQNFSEQAAATGVTVIFATGLAGKFLSGFLAERWGTSPVWLVHQVLLLLATVALTFGNTSFVWAALLCLGFGWGGCFSLTQVIIAEQFSGPMLGRLLGWFIAFEGIGSGSGSWLTGVMFDHFGSYRVPFLFCDGLLVASILATLFLPQPSNAAATPQGKSA